MARNASFSYVAGSDAWKYILEDHPEIRFLASVCYPLDEGDLETINAIRGDNPLRSHGFDIDDWDKRADPVFNLPSEENVQPIVDFLRE
ncbi:MAG: hypothetical protein OXH65_11935 [Paracoccaceae bacterium]|nr:hypothetical protein [Paracoccaceae bacterium]MDE2675805.1 hypothetical protein [Paracoccaceae bacterium]MDE2737897.1 hypothetical protein [Paracoccaceae bacterium]